MPCPSWRRDGGEQQEKRRGVGLEEGTRDGDGDVDVGAGATRGSNSRDEFSSA